MEFRVPARGLIGFRSEFTNTRGTGIMNHLFDGWASGREASPTARTALVADRAASYAIEGLQPRGELFFSPTDEIYEGMVGGERPRQRTRRQHHLQANRRK